MGVREFWLNVVRPWQQRRRLAETYTGPTAVPQPVKSLPAPAEGPVKARSAKAL